MINNNNNDMATHQSSNKQQQQQQQQHYLFELLKEDQEPFFLNDYIADKRFQLKNNIRKPIVVSHQKTQQSQNSLARKLLSQKASCFKSNSPNMVSKSKSPLFEFPSPISSTITKSPCNKNTNLLHIPTRTATLLLEAALKIQKHNKPLKHKPPTFGLFGSLLKRLTSHRTNEHNHNNNKRVQGIEDNIMGKSKTFDYYSRPSSTSGVWSEEQSSSTNCEDKSLDSETSCSTITNVDFVTKLMLNHDNECNDNNIINIDDQEDYFCDDESDSESCHQSPFHFVLQRNASSSSSSSGRRTPEFSSPASSPTRRRVKLEGKENNYVGDNSKDFQLEEEEEEKEQFSPVSVLDPPFEDDDYDIEPEDDHDHDDENEESFDMETSYAIVQRTKQQLLQKLRRFEQLAELDPIELEKRMLEDDDDEKDEMEEDCEFDINESNGSDRDVDDLDGLIREVLSEPGYDHLDPGHMKRLVSDLIIEERKEQSQVDSRDEVIVKCVAKRFESWKEVQSNTIDMMVEQDFKGEWNRNNKEQIGEIEIDIELGIFGLLLEELAQELVFV